VRSHQTREGVLLALRGELDLATVPLLEDALQSAEHSHELVVVDLRDLTFLDSTGLHVLISAEQRARRSGGRLVLVQGPPQVRRLLELTGAIEQLQVVSDPSSVLS
jgi:anti-anti-sigma factor